MSLLQYDCTLTSYFANMSLAQNNEHWIPYTNRSVFAAKLDSCYIYKGAKQSEVKS